MSRRGHARYLRDEASFESEVGVEGNIHPPTNQGDHIMNSKFAKVVLPAVLAVGSLGLATLATVPAGASTKAPHAVKAAASLTGTVSRVCLLYTSPSPRDRQNSRMPSSA